MNDAKFNDLVYQSGLIAQGCWDKFDSYDQEALKKYAELIVKECNKLNRKHSFELMGVIVDTEQGAGFDSICLDTVKRVHQYLADDMLDTHFGFSKNNLLAGAEIHSDKGYQLGTEEGYQEFVRKRNDRTI